MGFADNVASLTPPAPLQGIWDMRGTLRDEPFMRTPGLKHNKAAAALDKQKMQERFQQQQEQEE